MARPGLTHRRESPARRARRLGGWSAVEVAGAARVTLEMLRRIERGEVAGIRLGLLVRVAQVLGLSVCQMVPGLDARPARGALKPRPRYADRPRVG